MASERGSTLKLGIFVLVGTAILVLGLYMLGSKRDMFSSTLEVTARFPEVSGLRTGNNVRYAGIDVGTVKRIIIINDTTVEVSMMVRTDAADHIRSNALARIASDGLMGNKIVNIEPGEGPGAPLTDGAEIRTAPALDTDAMLRSLSRSNENVEAITTDLRELARRLNSDQGLSALLSDSDLVKDVRSSVQEVRVAATNARILTERVNGVVRDLQNGKGALGALTADSVTEHQVRRLMANLQHVTDSLALVTDRIGRFSEGLGRKDGLAYAFTSDTMLAGDVKRVIADLDTSTTLLNEDLRALQRNWLFRKYFKEKKREAERLAP